MYDAAASSVWIGATEALHVHLLAGDGTDDLRSGDENAAFGAENDDVGERRSIRGATGGRAQHHGDLRHLARDARHGGKDAPHRVEAGHALAQSRTTGVPDADNGTGVGEGSVIRRHDGAASGIAHRTALDGGVRREGDHLGAVDRPDTDEDAAIVLGSDWGESALVEEGFEAYAR